MNKIDFTNTGGFPLETDTLDFLQTSYSQLQELARSIAGNFPCVLTGCELSGGNVMNGTVIVDGEVLPFVGGVAGTYVNIVETAAPRTFKDGSNHDVYKTRYVTFTGSGILWSSFLRIRELVLMDSKLRNAIANIAKRNSVNDRDKLFGCVVSALPGNNYTHTAGSIYYNGTVYTVDALTTPLANPNSNKPKWAIDETSILVDKMKLVSSSSPSGLFVYDDISTREWQTTTSTKGAVGIQAIPVFGSATLEAPFEYGFKYKVLYKTMDLHFRVVAQVSGGISGIDHFMIPLPATSYTKVGNEGKYACRGYAQLDEGNDRYPCRVVANDTDPLRLYVQRSDSESILSLSNGQLTIRGSIQFEVE